MFWEYLMKNMDQALQVWEILKKSLKFYVLIIT